MIPIIVVLTVIATVTISVWRMVRNMRLMNSHGCSHKWLYQTVPFADMDGGWHICTQCGLKRYIH